MKQLLLKNLCTICLKNTLVIFVFLFCFVLFLFFLFVFSFCFNNILLFFFCSTYMFVCICYYTNAPVTDNFKQLKHDVADTMHSVFEDLEGDLSSLFKQIKDRVDFKKSKNVERDVFCTTWAMFIEKVSSC